MAFPLSAETEILQIKCKVFVSVSCMFCTTLDHILPTYILNEKSSIFLVKAVNTKLVVS